MRNIAIILYAKSCSISTFLLYPLNYNYVIIIITIAGRKKTMIYLKNDYSTGAHPHVLDALVSTNMENTVGYGLDPYCAEAADTIKDIINCENADVHFTMAGTQTNLTVISSILRPHEAVIAADTEHICVHEVGAIEATGHKVIHVPTPDGKLRPADIDKVMAQHCDMHWVRPKMIYIADLTLTGLVYTKAELTALRQACDKHDLYLFMDGARLAMALTQKDNDVTFADLPKICDVFYIGGTKCGLMFGEAIVIVNDQLKKDFRYIMKQKGAILAKGRLLGVQFKAIFENDLYLELGRHCNALADKLVAGLQEKGYQFACKPCSNLVFPIFSNELIDSLQGKVEYDEYEPYDEKSRSIRLVCSWSTTEEEVDEFLKLV